MVSSKKKWTVMNPIRRRMKKRNPSSGQNGQLVHWWLLIHSGPHEGPRNVELLPPPLMIVNVGFGRLYIVTARIDHRRNRWLRDRRVPNQGGGMWTPCGQAEEWQWRILAVPTMRLQVAEGEKNTLNPQPSGTLPSL
jgi:hypothetical protein